MQNDRCICNMEMSTVHAQALSRFDSWLFKSVSWHVAPSQPHKTYFQSELKPNWVHLKRRRWLTGPNWVSRVSWPMLLGEGYACNTLPSILRGRTPFKTPPGMLNHATLYLTLFGSFTHHVILQKETMRGSYKVSINTMYKYALYWLVSIRSC